MENNEKVLRDAIVAMDTRIDNLEADKKNLQDTVDVLVNKNNKLNGIIEDLSYQLNKSDTVWTPEEILRREG